MKKPWRLLAEILNPRNSAGSPEFGALKWLRLEIGPHRRVRCSCGGGVIDNPGSNTYEGGGCTHLVALYEGPIITDKREYDERERRRDRQGYSVREPFHFHGRFTELGRKMFYPRYTVQILR